MHIRRMISPLIVAIGIGASAQCRVQYNRKHIVPVQVDTAISVEGRAFNLNRQSLLLIPVMSTHLILSNQASGINQAASPVRVGPGGNFMDTN